jgi:hypothetical protein
MVADARAARTIGSNVKMTYRVQKNLRKVLCGLGFMRCKLLFPSFAEHHPR